MADTSVKIVDQSAHEVTYKLMQDVMQAERVATTSEDQNGWKRADRNYLLTLYQECRRVVIVGVAPR